MKTVYLGEGARFFARSLKARFFGVRKYNGDAAQICRQIVMNCFNGRYFQVSRGHFCEFYSRDFGWCAESLLKLGYRDEALKTLSYALEIFSKNKRVATTISPSGKPFDFPFYAPDSLAFIVRSLKLAKAGSLVAEHNAFLNREISKFFTIVIDPKTGLVRKDRHFSSMKDHSLRQSSCYDNTIAAMLEDSLKSIKALENPFKGYNFRKIIKSNFWNGSYFAEDASGSSAVTGDSNVFPFWTGIFSSRKMLKSSINAIQQEELDKPFPLRYTNSRASGKQKFIGLEFFAKGYERDTVWTHMGPLYISLVKQTSKSDFEAYKSQYRSIIEKYKNYLEIFTKEGKPYSTQFYYSDESMLWAANFLTL